jgi:hypothetical protein
MNRIPIEIRAKSEAHQMLLELYPPKLANKFLPEWYKKQKIYPKNEIPQQKELKNCPAIQDLITDGIIIPAWSDILIEKFASDSGGLKDAKWEFQCTVGLSYAYGSNEEWILNQPEIQFRGLEKEQFKLNIVSGYGALKLGTPYWFKTPPGYGIEFSDPFYHHRRNIKLFPGRVESDKWHETNFPFEFFTDADDVPSKQIIVRAGEPLMMLRPYKINEKVELVTHDFDLDFNKKQIKNSQVLASVTSDWNRYKKKLNELSEEE